MSKKTIIFQEYGKITYKEVDELFRFTILYHNRWSLKNIIEQSEFIVVSACRGLIKIALEKVNNKDYIFITDNISENIGYPKQIDNFLSLQSDKDSMVTAKMLYHAIYDSTHKLFPKMRLTDIYHNYKWLNERIISLYTTEFDIHIKDIFPNDKNSAIYQMISKFKISEQEAKVLFERWRKFHLIDYHPYDEWIPNNPNETLTIEQFKERMSITKIDIKKEKDTGALYFECDKNIRGEVMVKEIPQHPMMSKFTLCNSQICWLLHEEGEIWSSTLLAKF